jgi:hypothetical protein
MDLFLVVMTLVAVATLIVLLLVGRLRTATGRDRRPVELLVGGVVAVALVGYGLIARDCLRSTLCASPRVFSAHGAAAEARLP